jgi:hypothetical protein
MQKENKSLAGKGCCSTKTSPPSTAGFIERIGQWEVKETTIYARRGRNHWPNKRPTTH